MNLSISVVMRCAVVVEIVVAIVTVIEVNLGFRLRSATKQGTELSVCWHRHSNQPPPSHLWQDQVPANT